MATFNSLPALPTGAAPGGASGGIDTFDPELSFDESMLSVDKYLYL